MLCGNVLVLGDHNPHHWKDPAVDGATVRRGLIPRDFSTHPVGFYGTIPGFHAVQMPVVADPVTRLRDLKAAGALLSDVRRRGNPGLGKPIPSRDQNGKGYCWRHSGVSAVLLVRARDGQPYADLSAYAGACMIKNYRDEGGWGAQGVDDQIKRGDPTSEFWPQRSMSRANDNPATWENAALHRVDEGWIDLQAAQYDRNLTWTQFVSCWLSAEPTVNDYNWWSHSVCGMEPVEGAAAFAECRSEGSGKKVDLQEFERVWDMSDQVTGGMGCKIWNSWGDSWSDLGEGILTPQKAVPDGGVALRTVTASAV